MSKINYAPLDLAIEHHRAGRLPQAAAIYQQILAGDPNRADVLQLLAVLQGQSGQIAQAIELIQRSIALNPSNIDYRINLAEMFRSCGRLPDAIAAIAAAIQLQPNHARARLVMGNTLQEAGRLEEAIAAWKSAIQIDPSLAMAHCNLGTALKEGGQINAAITAWKRAIELDPKLAIAHSNLGAALKSIGNYEEALAAYDRAIELEPDYAEAHANLAELLRRKGRLEDAAAEANTAIQLRPDLAEAHNHLGTIYKAMGTIDPAIASYRKALSLRPNVPLTRSNLLFALQSQPNQDAAAIFREHRLWDRIHGRAAGYQSVRFANDRNPDRRLRIGYVSPDFRDHSVASLIELPLANHNPDVVEVTCYADLDKPDAVTERLKPLAHRWRDITRQRDERVAELIRSDQIDILIDLTGHTGENRLSVFALKPAPVQVTYVGYPDTTGLSAIDYRLSDAYADPPGLTDMYHSEQVVRLPDSFLSFRPASEALEAPVATPPASGPFVFGALNSFGKVNDPLLDWWAAILIALPESRLLANCPPGSTRLQTQSRLAQRGVDSSRVEFVSRLPRRQYLQLYSQMHLALDTFPYHGTLTTLESIWMGVPVVTLAGQRHVSRVGVSILSNLGFSQLIASTAEQYIQFAVELAKDPASLAAMRSGLRQRMQQSVLMDGVRMARNLESAYRQMWTTWCEKPQAV